jgi:hypothetical protein
VAAATFRVDVRTVRSWQEGSVELPEDQWEAIEAVLLARGGEKAARGDTAGLVQTLTGAGIAARNRRYATLIARREARREGEQEQQAPTGPQSAEWQRFLATLPDEQRDAIERLLRTQIFLIEARRDAGLDPTPEPGEKEDGEFERRLLEWVTGAASRPREEVQAESSRLEQELDALEQEQQAARRAAYNPAPAPVAPPREPREPTGRVIPLHRPPPPDVVLLPEGRHLEDHVSWRRWDE